jgi:hypothetical protein
MEGSGSVTNYNSSGTRKPKGNGSGTTGKRDIWRPFKTHWTKIFLQSYTTCLELDWTSTGRGLAAETLSFKVLAFARIYSPLFLEIKTPENSSIMRVFYINKTALLYCPHQKG